MSWLVSQKTLHRSRTLLGVGEGRCSLFPIFDSMGLVEWLMIVREGDPKIGLLRWEQDLLSGFWLWRRVVREWTTVPEAHDHVLGMDRLWHFDPWWVLGEARFTEHPAKALLKETNLPAYDTWKEVWFSRDLRQVRYVLTDGHHQPELFHADLLLDLEPQRLRVERCGSAPPRVAWCLRPVWARV
ncbi:MAG: hypothetical protein AAGK22_03130 [Acidobacteriota bacterium]